MRGSIVRIGLFGGSFDPVHVGHLVVCRAVAEQLRFDRVYLVPAAVPPHKMAMDLALPAHRLEMLQRAIQGEPLFEVCDFELHRPGPSYTILTVQEFRRRFGGSAELFWLIGADSLLDLPNWYQAEELVDLCRIVTAARPGWDVPDLSGLSRRFRPDQVERLRAGILQTPRIDISSSQVRRRVAQGLSIRYLVPEAVAEYISEHGLYRRRQDA